MGQLKDDVIELMRSLLDDVAEVVAPSAIE